MTKKNHKNDVRRLYGRISTVEIIHTFFITSTDVYTDNTVPVHPNHHISYKRDGGLLNRACDMRRETRLLLMMETGSG
jgi:hypothetical protein